MVDNNIRGRLTKKASRLLQQIADNILTTNPNAIFREGDSIMAFADYEIVKTDDQDYEIYRYDTLAVTFNSCRLALAWCIFDKYQKRVDANNLIFLEGQLTRKQSEMMHYRHYINSRKITQMQREITLDRLDIAKDQHQSLKKQIDKCLSVAKYCQQKGFDNETIRLRNTAN